MQAGYAPLVGTTAAISAFVWLLGLSYLYVELTTEERAMGAFVATLAGYAPKTVERLLKAYLTNRSSTDETFLSFARRHDGEALRKLAEAEV